MLIRNCRPASPVDELAYPWKQDLDRVISALRLQDKLQHALEATEGTLGSQNGDVQLPAELDIAVEIILRQGIFVLGCVDELPDHDP